MASPTRKLSPAAIPGLVVLGLGGAFMFAFIIIGLGREGMSRGFVIFTLLVVVVFGGMFWSITVQLRTQIDEEGITQPLLGRRAARVRWSEVSAVTFNVHRFWPKIVSIQFHSPSGSPEVNLSYWDRPSLLNSLRVALPSHSDAFSKMERFW